MTTTTVTSPMQRIETQRPCYSISEKFKPQDPLMLELDALDSRGLSSFHVPESNDRKQKLQGPKCEIIVTSNDFVPDDDDLSSIGSVEDEDAFFLFTPNSQRLDVAGKGNSYLTPNQIDNLSTFSLTPRKNNEEPILCIPEFSPSFVSAAQSTYTYQPQKRQRESVFMDHSLRSCEYSK